VSGTVQERVAVPAASALPAGAFRWQRKVEFAHCDFAGIVFTPRFVEMAHTAVENFYPEALGIDYYDLVRTQRVGLGYAHVGFDFLRTATLGDMLDFTVLVQRIGGASIRFLVLAHRDDTPIFRAELVSVTTDLDRHRPIPIPPAIRGALERYQETCQ
jgi:4-hydroxybenzoyl-CoA thioesterase